MSIDTQVAEIPVMPDEVRDEAEEFIRSLAAAAGDEVAVYALLRGICRKHADHETALGGMFAALAVLFTDCITTPTSRGEYAEVSLPTTV